MGEAGLDKVGPGLREVCETVGIPPVLHMGSCVDNTRILTVLTQMVEEGGLGDDIDQIPAVGLAPEWMSEKALSIGVYCVASGAYVIFGGSSPISGMPDRVGDSDIVLKYISEGWEKLYGGKMEFVADPDEMIKAHPGTYRQEASCFGFASLQRRSLWSQWRSAYAGDGKPPVADRRQAIYGLAAD